MFLLLFFLIGAKQSCEAYSLNQTILKSMLEMAGLMAAYYLAPVILKSVH